jgi:hypothetical protein
VSYPVSACRGKSSLPAGYSAEVAQFLNRLLTLPTPTRAALYAGLIDGLVADGVWSSLDVLCVAGADSATMLTDLKSGTYTPSIVGSITFTADRGYATALSSTVNYVRTGFNPSLADAGSAAYKRNSASFGVWQLNAAGGGAVNFPIMRSTADVNVELWPRFSTNGEVAINNAPAAFANPNDTSGLIVASRTASNAYTVDRNGVQLAALATASAAPENNELLFLYGGSTAWRIGAWFFGGGLTAGQRTAVYTRLQTYLSAIGAV